MMQHKTGHDILRVEPTDSPVKFYRGKKPYVPKILEILKNSEKPLNVHEVSKLAGINWITAKSALMDLVVGGEVKVYKSGFLFLFKIKNNSQGLSGEVKVTTKDDKVVFTTVVNGKKRKATLPLEHIHIYLRKPNEKIVLNFKKVFGVTVDADKLKEKILKVLPKASQNKLS